MSPCPDTTQEPGAKGGSDTETFVALRAEIDNWRWAGVPFYLRTGKRLQSRRTDIAIQFKSVPHNIFAGDEPILQANRLVIHLQPQEHVTLEILSKQPGLEGVRLQSVPLELSLNDAIRRQRTRIAYERLLLDALKGNSTLFVRRDEVEAAWQLDRWHPDRAGARRINWSSRILRAPGGPRPRSLLPSDTATAGMNNHDTSEAPRRHRRSH